jgi:curved DNA-binding protein CbpA
MDDDPHKILGLEPGAGRDEIARAYRTLVRRFPPELNPGRFARIQHAYDVLRSCERAMEEAHRAPEAALDALFPLPPVALRPPPEAPGPLRFENLEPLLRPLRRAHLERLLREAFGRGEEGT